MDLSHNAISVLTNAISTAKLFGIDSFAITENTISGCDADKTVVMFSDDLGLEDDASDMVIGVNRLDVLSNRFDLVSSTNQKFTVDTVIDQRNGYVMQLLMKTKGIKVDYRCANINTLHYPKQMHDLMKHSFEIPSDVATMITRSVAAMKGEKIMILCNNGNISFELEDADKDKCIIDTDIHVISSVPANFIHKYPMRMMSHVLRRNEIGSVQIGAKGTMRIVVNGLPIYLIPQI